MKRHLILLAAMIVLVPLSASASPPGDSIYALDPAQIAGSQTSADHETFAKGFEGEAKALDKKAEFHDYLAASYGRVPRGGLVFIGHCRQLAKQYKAAAQLNRELAAEHRKMAASAEK